MNVNQPQVRFGPDSDKFYNACGKEKSKRWRFSIRGLIGLMTGVSISLGLVGLANSDAIENDVEAGLIGITGLFLFVGSVGVFCGQLWNRRLGFQICIVIAALWLMMMVLILCPPFPP